MDRDPFKEYIKQAEPGIQERGYIWHTAVGLQAVDGLSTSGYLIETAIQNIEGRITLDQAEQLLNGYYEENIKDDEKGRTEEADKVSLRIAKVLSEKAFTFSPAEYISIHKNLFDGIYGHAGKLRDYNITKKEWVLDGATVIYASSTDLKETLEYDFSQEKNFSYKGLSMDEIIHHLALFISGLWQIHIFAEGNTRTTAVFLIKYLKTMGFDITNDIFAENAWYFRNALVRANYNNLKNDIHATTEFLELFLRNLLLKENNILQNRTMHISGIFKVSGKKGIYESKQDIGTNEQEIQEPKQDIKVKKQDIQSLKQDIDIIDIFSAELEQAQFSNKTIKNIEKLYAVYGNGTIFGRTNIVSIVGITPSPASELIKKLLDSNIIVPVKGMGKGKYKFKTCTY
ncbi:MAG: Fic family protein [Lachnospiraceae bacterium]|nr:Fic family protein [Lachnospiraceae bacterium]